MFTGIIESKGLIKEAEEKESSLILSIDLKDFDDPVIGESISINGVCLTLNEYKNKVAVFNLSKETILKTSFSKDSKGEIINWERALKMGDPMGGHIVLGHIDGIGKVKGLKKIDALSSLWTIEYPKNLDLFLKEKGSVALSGISLTVAKKGNGSIEVYLIEETLKRTNIESIDAGKDINIEVDVISRYSLGKWQ
tara:strand:- start:2938 stop:3522 length:585 start_codon:yes stop_codon:yes gene_type:complete